MMTDEAKKVHIPVTFYAHSGKIVHSLVIDGDEFNIMYLARMLAIAVESLQETTDVNSWLTVDIGQMTVHFTHALKLSSGQYSSLDEFISDVSRFNHCTVVPVKEEENDN